jgi:FkbM family methyltransferase
VGSNLLLSLASRTAQALPTPIRRAFYHLGPLTRWLRKMLNRAAPPGETLTHIAAGELAGASMFLDLHNEKDYWLGTYEPNLVDAVNHFIQPGMLIFDVGANIGYVSLLLAHRTGDNGQVYAFEALPANLERLKRNLSANSFAHKVQVIEGAVVNESGTVTFLVHKSTSMGKAVGSAGRVDEAYMKEINVNGLCLDDFVYVENHPAPDVVKMDIEGGEELALQGMRHLLQVAHPIIFLELHGEQAAHTAWQVLTSRGYGIYRMETGYPHIRSLDELDWKAYVVAYV